MHGPTSMTVLILFLSAQNERWSLQHKYAVLLKPQKKQMHGPTSMTVLIVLLSALVKRFGVSRMRDFFSTQALQNYIGPTIRIG